jgi:hypothetical protein
MIRFFKWILTGPAPRSSREDIIALGVYILSVFLCVTMLYLFFKATIIILASITLLFILGAGYGIVQNCLDLWMSYKNTRQDEEDRIIKRLSGR